MEEETQDGFATDEVVEERARYAFHGDKSKNRFKAVGFLGICLIASVALGIAILAFTGFNRLSSTEVVTGKHDDGEYLLCGSIEIQHSKNSECDFIAAGSSCDFGCESGYAPSGPLFCDLYGEWQHPYPTCEKTCFRNTMPSLEYRYEQSLEYCNDMESGRSCSFKCNPGLIASGKYDCYRGQWGNAPSCVCPSINSLSIPGINPLTTAACEGTNVGSSCELTCLHGEKIDGDPTCTPQGWTSLPKCVVQTSPHFYGYVEGCELTIVDGCCTSWSCKDGISKGSAGVNSAGEWDISQASCESYCPLIEEKHITSNCYGTVPGTICPIDCANDLIPTQNFAYCDHFGWTLPTCKCSDPYDLHIPNIGSYGSNCIGLEPGDSCIVYCNDVNKSATFLECSKEGVWDRGVCVCDPIDIELIPGVDPDSLCGPSYTPVGGICDRIECLHGRKEVGYGEYDYREDPGPATCTTDGWINIGKCVCDNHYLSDDIKGFSKGCEGIEIGTCCSTWECNGDLVPSGFASCEPDGYWNATNAKCVCTTEQLNNALKFTGVIARYCDRNIGQSCPAASYYFECVYDELTLNFQHFSDAFCDEFAGWTFEEPPKCVCLDEDITVFDFRAHPIDCNLKLGQSCTTFACTSGDIDERPRIDCTKEGWVNVVEPLCDAPPLPVLSFCPEFSVNFTDAELLMFNINGHDTEFPECNGLTYLECCQVTCFSMSQGYAADNKMPIEVCIPCDVDGAWEISRTSGCLCKPSQVQQDLPQPCINTDACYIVAIDSEFVFGGPTDCTTWCEDELGFEDCYGGATPENTGGDGALESAPGNCDNIGQFNFSCGVPRTQGACICGDDQRNCPPLNSFLPAEFTMYNIEPPDPEGDPCLGPPALFLQGCNVDCIANGESLVLLCGPLGEWQFHAACSCSISDIKYLPKQVKHNPNDFYFPLFINNNCETVCSTLEFSECVGTINGGGAACWELNTFESFNCDLNLAEGGCICSNEPFIPKIKLADLQE